MLIFRGNDFQTVVIGCYHREFAGIVGIVVPDVVIQVPGVKPSGKSHQAVSVLPPDSEPEYDLVVSQMGIVVHGEDGLGLNGVERLEPIVQAVFLGPNNFDGDPDIRPSELGRRRILKRSSFFVLLSTVDYTYLYL